MPAPNSISAEKLARLIGTAKCPAIVDVRIEEDFAADPHLIPSAVRRPALEARDWAGDFAGQAVVAVCQRGLKLSEGAAAWLRQEGLAAEVLEGGHEAWRQAGQAMVAEAKLPQHDSRGRTVWVTRSRPKVDRVACLWLIRRFVDPSAVFLYVAPSEVEAVAERFSAAAFDIEDTFWSHRGAACTFDTMIEEFGLDIAPLRHLADIVRGADTARLDLAPECAGLLAASLGLSRMYADDLEQLDAAMLVYDSFYRWCRDATDEPHTWPASKAKA